MKNKNKIQLKYTKDSRVIDVLKRNNFFNYYNLGHKKSWYDTHIKYKVFSNNQKTEFQSYVTNDVLPKISDYIAMTNEFKDSLSTNIEEIYQNARTHGCSKDIFTCGQLFPRHKKIHFTIADLGISIKSNIINNISELSYMTDTEAIEWATIIGNSTRPHDETGGIGLYVLKDFIKLNKGSISILSGNGLWEIEEQHLLSNSFNGVLVNLEINLSDENMYDVVKNIDCFEKSIISFSDKNDIIDLSNLF